MAVPDLSSFIAAPDLAGDPEALARLESSAKLLMPRLDSVVDRIIERCPSMLVACGADRTHAARIIRGYLELVLENLSDLDSARPEIQELGAVFPDELQARIAIVDSMARACSYTWTRSQSMDWTRVVAMTMNWTNAHERQAA